MKLTEARLKQIIIEEYKKILSEKTVRLKGGVELQFQGRDKVLILSKGGRVGLDKKDVRVIINSVRQILPSAFV